jgi:hypothetical protein
MSEWLSVNGALLWWLGALSIVTFVGTLTVIPILVVRIPADYFTRKKRESTLWKETHPMLRGLLLCLKNLAGVVFVMAGVAMLVLPGQGILTILIGVMLMDFPGKFTLERSLVCRPAVLRAINWIRARAHKTVLAAPGYCSTAHVATPKQSPHPHD